MGILKDHISIISFLKPGIIKILSKSGRWKLLCWGWNCWI
jgi:F0F1-type ATP synthase epsilon subunit